MPVVRSRSASREPPGPTISAAISGSSSTRNASRVDSEACRRSVRRFSIAIVSFDSTRPSPWHVGQVAVMISRTPSVTFWRVISTRPSGEIDVRYTLERSFFSSSCRQAITASRFFCGAMSMKSITIIPPMSRSRSWRTTSRAASRLFARMVSSSRDLPTNRPVLTSMTVNASA